MSAAAKAKANTYREEEVPLLDAFQDYFDPPSRQGKENNKFKTVEQVWNEMTQKCSACHLCFCQEAPKESTTHCFVCKTPVFWRINDGPFIFDFVGENDTTICCRCCSECLFGVFDQIVEGYNKEPAITTATPLLCLLCQTPVIRGTNATPFTFNKGRGKACLPKIVEATIKSCSPHGVVSLPTASNH